MISSTAKGLIVMIDPDVKIGGKSVNYLHWLKPNVNLSAKEAAVPTTNDNSVRYFQPSPPANDPPHKYTFLLYSQPENFKIPAKYSKLQSSVLGFDLNAFATAAGLDQPKAATYMQVQRS